MKHPWKRAAFLAVVFTAVLAAQPTFEIASVKFVDPDAPGHMAGLKISSGGRVVITSMPVKGLIMIAFGLGSWQLSGGEPWMEKEAYDVEARPPADLQPPITNLRHGLYDIDDERLCQMLQALLVERFHLKFHRETKTGKVYLLEIKGSTGALTPADDASTEKNTPETRHDYSVGFAGKWNMSNTSMSQLAKFATDHVMRAAVIDRTELSGYFKHRQTTDLAESEIDYRDTSGSFLLFLKEMGLKLEPGKGPVETFVIESAEKPTPN